MDQPERNAEFMELLEKLGPDDLKVAAVVLHLKATDPEVKKMNAEQMLALHDRLSGNAAQLTATNGRVRRELRW